VVLLAQLLVAGAAPSLLAGLFVGVVVTGVACAVPTRTARGTAALAGLAQLAGHAVVAFTSAHQSAHQGSTSGAGRGPSDCLSVVRRGADLGVRYAAAQQSDCPPGTAPAGPVVAVVVAAVAAAVLVLAGSAVLATVTGVLVVAASAGLEVVRSLAAVIVGVLPWLLGGQVVPTGVRVPPLPEPRALSDVWQRGRAPRRGPPAGVLVAA
jgi:hypothetical protein